MSASRKLFGYKTMITDNQTPAAIDPLAKTLDAPPCTEPSLCFPGEPDVPILWAAAWKGTGVRCLFHRESRPECAACSGDEQQWSLLHRTVASLTELLNGPDRNGPTQMFVLIREREMQLTAVNEDGPLITLAIPPGPDVLAAQAWMKRWAALKVYPPASRRQDLAS